MGLSAWQTERQLNWSLGPKKLKILELDSASKPITNFGFDKGDILLP